MVRTILGFILLLFGCLCSLSMSAVYVFGTNSPTASFGEYWLCGMEGRLVEGRDEPAFGFARIPACEHPDPERAGSVADEILTYVGTALVLAVFGALFLFGVYMSRKAKEIEAAQAAAPPRSDEELILTAKIMEQTQRTVELDNLLKSGRINQAQYDEEMKKMIDVLMAMPKPKKPSN